MNLITCPMLLLVTCSTLHTSMAIVYNNFYSCTLKSYFFASEQQYLKCCLSNDVLWRLVLCALLFQRAQITDLRSSVQSLLLLKTWPLPSVLTCR